MTERVDRALRQAELLRSTYCSCAGQGEDGECGDPHCDFGLIRSLFVVNARALDALEAKDAQIERLRAELTTITRIPNSEAAQGIMKALAWAALRDEEGDMP